MFKSKTKRDLLLKLFIILGIFLVPRSVLLAFKLKTAGTDYALYMVQTDQRMLEEATWLGQHHDLIIAPNNLQAGASTGRQMSVEYYDAIMAANPNAIVITYVPYNTVTQVEKDWMENWAVNNGYDVEDLYYHYYIDTTIRDRSGVEHTIPGYGGGSANTLAESRVPSLWLSTAYPNVAPTLPVFRQAFIEYLKYRMVLIGAESDATKRLKGVLLDTFNGTINSGNLGIYLENTREVRQAVAGYVAPQMVSHVKEMTQALEADPGIPMAWVFPNIAEMSIAYHWFKDLGGEVWDSEYNKMYNEYFARTSVMRQSDIKYLVHLYDDMESGVKVITQAESGFANSTGGSDAPDRWIKGIIARLYLVAHPNQFAAYHWGTATYYGPYPRNSVDGTYEKSTWSNYMSYDLGQSVTRASADYWGVPNTNRFFTLHYVEEDNWYCIAREFSKGLVMQVFGNGAGEAAVGTVPHTVPLGGTYRELNQDLSLGPPITELTLGLGEGAILIKESTIHSTRADVDNSGSINSIDAMLTLQKSLGLDMSATDWFSSTTTGDVNCDGTTNSTDAMLILRHSLGLDMSGTGWCE